MDELTWGFNSDSEPEPETDQFALGRAFWSSVEGDELEESMSKRRMHWVLMEGMSGMLALARDGVDERYVNPSP